MPQGRITLTRYTIEEEHKHPGASGEFSGLLNSLATAIKIISNQVNKGALVGALGNAGGDGVSVNVQGEVQKKLDVMSNDVMLHENQWNGHLSGMASEEMENVYVLPAHALEVTRGGHIAVGAGTAEELVALEHDKFTVLGVETQPVPVAPAPKRRRKRGLC